MKHYTSGSEGAQRTEALSGLHQAQLPPDAKYLAAEFQNLLVKGDKDLQYAILDALSSLGKDSAVALEAIRFCERSGDDRVREAAEKLEKQIYEWNSKTITMAQLVTWLDEVNGRDPPLRTPALIGLSQSQLPPEAKSLAPRFNALLVKGDTETRYALLCALSSLGAKSAFALEGIRFCAKSTDISMKGLAVELEDVIAGKPRKVKKFEPTDLRGGAGER